MSPTVYQVTTTPGTPIRAITSQTRAALIWAINLSSSQVVSFGNINLSVSTKAGVIALIPPTSSGATPDSNILKLPPGALAEDPYDVSDYYVDSVTAALVSIVAWTL